MPVKSKPLPASESLFENPEENNVSTAITTIEVQPPVVQANPMAIIQAAVDRGMDPAQLTQLFDLQERWEKNRAAEAFGTAMARFQANCPVVHKAKSAKSSGNFQGYTYASYDDVMRAASPVLKECGLAVSFSTEQVEKQLKVTVRIRHGIHYEDSTLTVPVPDMRVNDTQKYGAALLYAKRYALCAALNIVTSDEDNDAEGLGEVITQDQYALLDELITDTKADRAKFLEWLGVDAIGNVRAGDFDRAYQALKRKQQR